MDITNITENTNNMIYQHQQVQLDEELDESLYEVVDGGNRPLINAVGSANWYPSPKTAVPSSSSPHIFQHSVPLITNIYLRNLKKTQTFGNTMLLKNHFNVCKKIIILHFLFR